MQGEFLIGIASAQAVLRRWWVVAACTLVLLGAAIALSAAATPMYSATAQVLVNQQSASDVFDPNASAANNTSVLTRQVVNEARFIESDIVRQEAESRLRFDAEITALTDSSSDVISLRAEAADPREAQTIAQVFAESYLKERRQRFVDDFVLASTEVQSRINEINSQLVALPNTAVDEEARLQNLRQGLIDSRDQLNIAADLASGSGGQIIGVPELPESPFAPQTLRNLVLGVIAGLALGVSLALLLEALDQSIPSVAELENATGVSNLAVVPSASKGSRRDSDGIISLDKPEAQAAEAYRTLRAALQFMTIDATIDVLQVTSANPGEGKTTTAANLAVAMAMTGRSVVVVDGDLRRPRLHERFGTTQGPGLTNVVLGEIGPGEAEQGVSGTSGALSVVPSGPIPPFPSELLSHRAAYETVKALRATHDLVIIDSPPVLPVADALVISRLVDATILVANGRKTQRGAVAEAMELLRKVDAPVVGSVLNEVKRRRWSRGYGYGYGYRGYTAGAPAGGGLLKSRSRNSDAFPTGGRLSESVERVLGQPRPDAASNGASGDTGLAPALVAGSRQRDPVPSWLGARNGRSENGGDDQLLPQEEPRRSKGANSGRLRAATTTATLAASVLAESDRGARPQDPATTFSQTAETSGSAIVERLVGDRNARWPDEG